MTFQDFLRQNPFYRILTPLVIGILLSSQVNPGKQLVGYFIAICFLVCLLAVGIPHLRKSFSWRMLFGIFAFFLWIGIGSYRNNQVQKNYKLSELDSTTSYIAKLTECPTEKSNSYSCQVEIISSKQADGWKRERAQAMIYFQKDSSVGKLLVGDQILMNKKMEVVKNAGNPFEFDYASFLRNKHIYYSAFLPTTKWTSIEYKRSFDLYSFAQRWRGQLLGIYKENGISGNALDILSALTLGYKTNLDPELKRAWAKAGAIHVLAVSGLHVGIIYLIMGYFLRAFKGTRWGRILRGLILLLVLWMYALLTGLSPSVMRAAGMFSFFVVGEMFHRKGSVYNTLAASAVCLLLFDPRLLYNVGFQFSYLAVLGIVFFQPKFDKLLCVPNPVLNKLWQLTTVGIAAQLATFPLSVYYFNQFPAYFLLSGYVVITMAAFLIYLSVLLLVLSPIHWLGNILAWVLQQSVNFMNWSVLEIQSLPGAVIEGLSLSPLHVIVLYMFLITLIFIFVLKRKRAVLFFLCLLILWQIPVLMEAKPKHEMVIFNAGKNSMIAFTGGETTSFVVDKDMPVAKMQRLSQAYLLHNKIKSFQVDTLHEFDIRLFDRHRILCISKYHKNIRKMIDSLHVDMVFVRKGGPKNLDTLQTCKPKKIVVDGSVYGKRGWKTKEYEGLDLYDIQEKGAFVYSSSPHN